MEEEQRLSRMVTQWSIVRCAHDSESDDRRAAQRALLERYGGAIRRYLLACLRDNDAADEVFQDFALRFVRGDFQCADPEHGRFRSFVKTVISHMVVDFHRRQQRRVRREALLRNDAAELLAGPDDRPPAPDALVASWRDDLLARCWEQLRDLENRERRPLYTVLRFRADHAEADSQQLAEILTAHLGRPLTAGNVRVLVHRAREKFAELLLKEVADSLGDGSLDQLEQELIELRLHDYCRDALARLRQQE